MAEAQATTLGDRFERAIERHADTAGEIARGGEEKPHNLRRNVIWLAITWASLTLFSITSLAVMFGLQVATNACLWNLQRPAPRANHGLVEAGVAGLAIFAVTAAVGAVLPTTDQPLAWVGRVVRRMRNRLRPKRPPLRTLPHRLLSERDRILDTLGPRWKHALASSVARWIFDYMTLMAVLTAMGSHPRPSLVLPRER